MAAPNRQCAPPGAETFRSEVVSGTKIFDNGKKLARVTRISRFAWRGKPQVLLESSAMWKGELAPCEVCVHPGLQSGKGTRTAP